MISHSIAIARQRQAGPRVIAARMGAVCPGAWDVGGFYGDDTRYALSDRMRRRRVR
jgi:hypothetical protein